VDNKINILHVSTYATNTISMSSRAVLNLLTYLLSNGCPEMTSANIFLSGAH